MLPLLLLLLGGATIYTINKKNTKISSKNESKTKNIVPINTPKSELNISKDCRTFSFNDKTGNKWWELEGRKIAQKFVKIYSDSLMIAFGILNEWSNEKNISDCFKYAYQKAVPNGFPVLEFGDLSPQEIGIFNEQELWYKRIVWIQRNPQMWNLIWQVRNRVNIEFFSGRETIIANPSEPNYGLTFGKQFNEKIFLEKIKPMILVLLKLENDSPGILLGKEYADDSYLLINTATYMFWIILPNIPFDNLLKKHIKAELFNIPFYKELVNFVGKCGDDVINMEF